MDKISTQNISKAFPDILTGKKQVKGLKGKSFSEVIQSSINDVDKLQKDSDNAVRNLATGEERDIHKTMITMEKADISLQLLMKVRSKIINAYQEIMRTQM